MSLLGAVFMGIGGPILGFLDSTSLFAPAIIGIGAFFTALSFYRQPQLAYILPFKAFRLMVFETEGGIDLFSFSWNEIYADESTIDLFSTMLQGIGGILQEALRKGALQEIHLERVILLLQRGVHYPITSVLVTSKSSPYLRQSLKVFTERFEQIFGVYFPRINDTTIFSAAELLVADCFRFVPEYGSVLTTSI